MGPRLKQRTVRAGGVTYGFNGLVELMAVEGEIVGEPALRYLNRLSDLLFVAARRANDDGAADVLWKPGATR